MIDIFKLVKERCLMSSLNIRTEMHGDQRESAIDIAFEFDSANNLLLKLNPDLRATFYRQDDTKDLATPDHMPHLRFPLLGPVSWELEIPRTKLRVHDVDDESHDVVLGGGRTNKFKLTMKQGGTVNWKFRVQFSKPDEEQVARLMRVLNQKVPVSLECVDEEEKPDNFEKVEQLSLVHAPSEARRQLESLFDKPATDMTIANGTSTPADDPDFKEVLDEVVLPNDGAQPGDAGHSYTAQPAADTVTVESVHNGSAGLPDDVVDATFIPDAEQVETGPVAIVLPIKKRASRKKAEAAEIE